MFYEMVRSFDERGAMLLGGILLFVTSMAGVGMLILMFVIWLSEKSTKKEQP
jgi:hypothetical protein